MRRVGILRPSRLERGKPNLAYACDDSAPALASPADIIKSDLKDLFNPRECRPEGSDEWKAVPAVTLRRGGRQCALPESIHTFSLGNKHV